MVSPRQAYWLNRQRRRARHALPSGASFYADFVSGRYWDGAETDLGLATDFTRASAGLADDTSGAWPSFATDVARITDKGIRIEPARTNLCTLSQGFDDDAVWAPSLASPAAIVANQANSPVDGLLVADLMTVDGASSTPYRRDHVTVVDTSTYTASIFVKAAPSGSATHFRLTSNNVLAWNTGGSTKIALTNDWQRVTLTWVQSGSTAAYVIIGAVDAAGAKDTDCYGDVLISDAQCELGSYASAPIVTAGATATRAVDALTLHLPSGTHDLTFTFDDDSTQEITGESGDYVVPTTLDRPVIKTIAAFLEAA